MTRDKAAPTYLPSAAASDPPPVATITRATAKDALSQRVGPLPADPDPDHGDSKSHSTPITRTSRRDQDLLLYLFADQLDDVEKLRIATENRLRTLFSDENWGKGVPAELPEAQALISHLEQIRASEHGITLSLKRAMRDHRFGPWCKSMVGVGEKQLGRLLAVIGDPGAREKPSQLWAYCGLHVLHPGQADPGTHRVCAGVDPTSDPGQGDGDIHHVTAGVAPTRRRGQRVNWSTDAKKRVYLIATACIRYTGEPDKNGNPAPLSPYRAVYDDGRRKYAEATHAHECRRCGAKGNPAKPGSPLSDGHKHARAIRLVMKRVLLDLWKEARKELP